jgi:hypothetical protein
VDVNYGLKGTHTHVHLLIIEQGEKGPFATVAIFKNLGVASMTQIEFF